MSGRMEAVRAEENRATGERIMAKVSVIGAGSWGMAIAKVLENNGHEVMVWSHREEEAERLREKRENEAKLPGVRLSERTEFTSDLKTAVSGRDLLIPCISIKSMIQFQQETINGRNGQEVVRNGGGKGRRNACD